MSGAADVPFVPFGDRATLEQAHAWVDAQAASLARVEVGVSEATGRVPASALVAPAPFPPAPRAGEDGHAVRAAETVGATAGDPVRLRLQVSAPLLPGGALAVAAGEPLPAGADAVVPAGWADASGPFLEVAAAVPDGSGVERPGDEVTAGAPIVVVGRPLRPLEAALLAALGVARLDVFERPRVRLLVPGPKPCGPGRPGDANTALLAALVERDGGIPERVDLSDRVEDPPGAGRAGALASALERAFLRPGADLVMVAGRSGAGADDEAPRALSTVGRIDFRGLALRPGGSTAAGVAGGRPVLLLPGDPLACLAAYELVAGRLVRRLAGRDPGLPHPRSEAVLARKLVSAVGSVDLCPVRLAAGRAEPLGVEEWGGLGAAAPADGFVLVPAALEGYPAGARVTVRGF